MTLCFLNNTTLKSLLGLRNNTIIAYAKNLEKKKQMNSEEKNTDEVCKREEKGGWNIPT